MRNMAVLHSPAFSYSVARSRASFIQSVDIQRENTLLQQI